MLYLIVFAHLAAWCGVEAETEQAFVDALNKVYQSYDPQDDSSPKGVMITAFDGSVANGWMADCKDCGDLYGIPLKTSNCKISASIVNEKNYHLGSDWKSKKFFNLPGLCQHAGTCDLELGIYPVGPGGPAGRMYTQGGAIFGPAAESSIKCSYPFDGASMTRPNSGCGCTSLYGTVCPPNKKWPCPTTLNTCSDKDPLSHFWNPHPINANSTVLSACQCTEMGITETDDPLWSGILGLEYPPSLPKCVWQGPQYFEGKGRDEVRQALRQQYNFRKHATFAWNEIVLDGRAYNNLFEKQAAETIKAFWYPSHKNCGKKCKSAMYTARDEFAKKYGVHLPVVMIDVNHGAAPFKVADPGALDEADDADVQVEQADAIRDLMWPQYLARQLANVTMAMQPVLV